MAGVVEGLLLIAEALVYPGLLFLVALGLFVDWFMRKLAARMQGRVGPYYAGPHGLLQPLYDILKLMRKEVVAARGVHVLVAVAAASFTVSGLSAVMLMTPLAPRILAAPGDIIVFAYLLLLPAVAVAVAGFAAANPYSIKGAARFLSMVVVVEPLFFTLILIPVLAATLYDPSTGYSVTATINTLPKLWLDTSRPYWIALLTALPAAFMINHAKMLLRPFDIPEAETEIVEGPLVEYSGTTYAYLKLLHLTEKATLPLIFTIIYLGGPYPYPLTTIQGTITLATKYLATLFIHTWIHTSTPRMRIEQAIDWLISYPGLLTLTSLTITLTTYTLNIKIY